MDEFKLFQGPETEQKPPPSPLRRVALSPDRPGCAGRRPQLTVPMDQVGALEPLLARLACCIDMMLGAVCAGSRGCQTSRNRKTVWSRAGRRQRGKQQLGLIALAPGKGQARR
jgi:hypothetical protein